MVNAFVSLKTEGDDDQFKKELQYIIGHLICTLISENQGLFQTLEKFQNLHPWIFFSVYHLDFFQVYGINLAFFLGGDLEKNPGLQDLKFF